MYKSVLISMLISVLLVAPFVRAEEQGWSGSGDGTSWADGDNWFAKGVPEITSDVTIEDEDAAVVCNETFTAKSITVGGRETSSLTINNFIRGTIQPDATTEDAIINRPGGTIILTGSGRIIVKGRYASSKDTPASGPSLLFWLE